MNQPSSRDKRLITILSIDGGGMRGVIPGCILAVLEEELQKIDGKNTRIADYFDYIAGTSTGGIVTAILTTPCQNGRPRPATEINKFYRESGPDIFSSTMFSTHAIPEVESIYKSRPKKEGLSKVIENGKKAWKTAKVLFETATRRPRYHNSCLQGQLANFLPETHQLAETLTDVVIPAYDLKTLHPIIFSTQQAKATKSNIKMEDVLMGTTAAPYYFSPYEFNDNGQSHTFVDGGIAANNPTLLAIKEATRIIENISTPYEFQFLVLSLGTGSAKLYGHHVGHGGFVDWLNLLKHLPLVDVLMRAADDMVDIYTTIVLTHCKSRGNFLRIQDNTLKPEEVALDDASPSNIERLEEIAESLLEKPESKVNPKTFLQVEPSDSVPRTNYEAIIDFAEKLSAEKKHRLTLEDPFPKLREMALHKI